MRILRPARLRRGDVIGLVAPASPPRHPGQIEGSVRYLESLGYRVRTGRHLESRHGFSAGTDIERAADLNTMFRDPQVRAIFALRGGNGCCRLLRHLDYAAVRRDPKILAGYSDITFLQLALHRRTGLVSFSGPMPGVEFWRHPDPFTEEQFWALLTSRARRRILPAVPGVDTVCVRTGVAEGRLLGGCCSLVASLLGTPFLPDLRGALLFLEDVREEPHRIHRMLTQFDLAGALRRVAGLVLGQFTAPGQEPGEPHMPLPDIYRETLAEFRGPVLGNLGYGHVPRKLTLPQGVLARLDAGRGRITLQEPAVE